MYIKVLKEDIECKDMMDEFRKLCIDLKNCKDPIKKEEIKKMIGDLKTNLPVKIKAKNSDTENQLFKFIGSTEFATVSKQLFKTQYFQLMKDTLDKKFVINETTNLIECKISKEKTDLIANKLVTSLSGLEKETIVINLSGEVEKEFLSNFFEIHLSNLLEFSMRKNLLRIDETISKHNALDKSESLKDDIVEVYGLVNEIDVADRLTNIANKTYKFTGKIFREVESDQLKRAEDSTNFYKNLVH